MHPATARLRPSGKVFVVCGLWLVALGTYFLFARPALLPEDAHYIGRSFEALRSAAPGLERWLGRVFNVMGGFMIASGVLTALAAYRLLARREPGTFAALSVAGAAGDVPPARPRWAVHHLRLGTHPRHGRGAAVDP